ncbi:MAG: hypothetical protein K0Q56_992 [Sporolactobacillus laevolacticus]|jgi:hypothetical protein|nr:hypothetical protein [Sporolactobacillus laevolacticus]
MKNLTVVVTLILTCILITGCSEDYQSQSPNYGAKQSSSNNKSYSSSKAGNSSNGTSSNGSSIQSGNSSSSVGKVNSSASAVKTGSLQQVLRDTRSLLKSQNQVRLPQTLPVEKGKYISAIVKKDSPGYTVTFKQTNTPIQVNNKTLTKAKTVTIFKAIGYASSAETAKQITFHAYGKSDGQAVDLGYSITGYADAGAGTAGISWNEGRWTLMVLSPTADAENGKTLARKVVAYLERHTLPIPHQYGVIQLYTDNRQSMVRWQDGKTIYELSGIENPMSLLAATVSVN